jgi:hypothetical protein
MPDKIRYQNRIITLPTLKELKTKRSATLLRLRTLKNSQAGIAVDASTPRARPQTARQASLPRIPPPVASPHARKVAAPQPSEGSSGNVEIAALSRVYGLCIRLWHKVGDGLFAPQRRYPAGDTDAKAVDIVSHDTHYAALRSPRRQGDRVHATELTTPADGDSLYHAVAEAAGFPEIDVICHAYRNGSMAALRKNAHIMAWVDHPESMSDAQLYGALRHCYVLQMRHDVAKEFAV